MDSTNTDFNDKLLFLKEVCPAVSISDLEDRLRKALANNQTVDSIIEEILSSSDSTPPKNSENNVINLVSDEPIQWGNESLVEDSDFKLAMKLYEQELRDQYNPNKRIADVHQSRMDQQKVNKAPNSESILVNDDARASLPSQLQEIRALQEQRYKQQRGGAAPKPRDTSKPKLPSLTVHGQLNDVRRRQKDKWRSNTLEQKPVWTLNDLTNKTKFEEETKAGGWIGSSKQLNENSTNEDEIGRLALEYTNKFRQEHKLPPLKWHQVLANIGRVHSKGNLSCIISTRLTGTDMGDGKVPFSHQGFDNRVKQMPGPLTAAENLAMNVGHANVARTAVNGWINSPGHRRNLLASHDYCGIGVYRNSVGKWYLTQLFMRTS